MRLRVPHVLALLAVTAVSLALLVRRTAHNDPAGESAERSVQRARPPVGSDARAPETPIADASLPTRLDSPSAPPVPLDASDPPRPARETGTGTGRSAIDAAVEMHTAPVDETASGPNRDDVRAAFASVAPAIAACNPGSAAIVPMTVEFAGNGTVRRVLPTANYPANQVSSCLTRALAAARIRPFRSTSVTVIFPILYDAGLP